MNSRENPFVRKVNPVQYKSEQVLPKLYAVQCFYAPLALGQANGASSVEGVCGGASVVGWWGGEGRSSGGEHGPEFIVSRDIQLSKETNIYCIL